METSWLMYLKVKEKMVWVGEQDTSVPLGSSTVSEKRGWLDTRKKGKQKKAHILMHQEATGRGVRNCRNT